MIQMQLTRPGALALLTLAACAVICSAQFKKECDQPDCPEGMCLYESWSAILCPRRTGSQALLPLPVPAARTASPATEARASSFDARMRTAAAAPARSRAALGAALGEPAALPTSRRQPRSHAPAARAWWTESGGRSRTSMPCEQLTEVKGQYSHRLTGDRGAGSWPRRGAARARRPWQGMPQCRPRSFLTFSMYRLSVLSKMSGGSRAIIWLNDSHSSMLREHRIRGDAASDSSTRDDASRPGALKLPVVVAIRALDLVPGHATTAAGSSVRRVH